MWAYRPAEHLLVVAALEAVGGRLLLRGPAARKVVRGRDLVEHDRAVANGRTDDSVSGSLQRIHEGAETLRAPDPGVGVDGASLGHHPPPSIRAAGRGGIRTCPAGAAEFPHRPGGSATLRARRGAGRLRPVAGTLSDTIERRRIR